MDLLFGHDRKYDYLDEPDDMVDFLDTNDIFDSTITGFPSPEEEGYEHDWLNSILEGPVLNDRMMTDAMQPPCIKSEHSYSISEAAGSPLGALAAHDDVDGDLFPSNQSALDLTVKSVATSPAIRALKFESTATNTVGNSTSTSTSSLTSASNISNANPHHNHHHHMHHHQQLQHQQQQTPTNTLSISGSRHQPTIIVTTTSTAAASSGYSLCNGDSSSSSCTNSNTNGNSVLSFPTIQIKQEIKQEDSMDSVLEQKVNLESMMMMPLTPPGSSGSDSEGCSSPNRSAPGSPDARQSQHGSRHTATVTSASSPGSPMAASTSAFSQPLFVSPISQSGVLILSEEEKRTLISEGYTIPSKLPLTKQEEKNLKKIRRKIKNKISAQESRRKKKEYLEALEKRVEAYNHENCDLKKKVESLENNNRSLLGQLQKLQALVSKVNKANATQTGTALMVLVFCFAVFLGSFSPSNLNIGYPTKPAQLPFVAQSAASAGSGQSEHHHHHHPHHPSYYFREAEDDIGPRMTAAHDTSNPYATPNLKSRMLMSVDQEDYCDDYRPVPWQSSLQSCPTAEQHQQQQPQKAELDDSDVMMDMIEAPSKMTPSVAEVEPPTVVVIAQGAELNATDKEREELGLELRAELVGGMHHNMSAEFGTL